MTSSSTRSSARAESGRSESRPGVSPRESISEKKATALNAVAFFVDLPPLGPPSWYPVSACVRDGCCRRNCFSLPQRRLESDADRCCGRDRCHSGGFLLRIMSPSWHPAPACTPRLRCRRNHSSLPQRKSEPDADRCCSRDRCHTGGFLLRIMPSSWHPVPACTPRLRCRRSNLICGDDKSCSDSQVWA